MSQFTKDILEALLGTLALVLCMTIVGFIGWAIVSWGATISPEIALMFFCGAMVIMLFIWVYTAARSMILDRLEQLDD